MVIRELLNECIRRLDLSGNDNSMFEAHLIVRQCLKMSALDLVLKKSNKVCEKDADKIFSIINRRTKGEPLQYILGTQEFMGLEFKVTPDVLIPRADTEVLVEYILSKYPGKGILALDIGTGSGCIAISIAHFNKNAYLKALDISPKAIEIAEYNAKKNNVASRISFINTDIFKFSPSGRFDLIVSNPPYIESDIIPTLDSVVKDYEPSTALDGGADGLDFYRYIISVSPKMLNDGGMLAFEIGYDQAKSVSELMQKDFCNIEILKDYGGNDRVVAGILKERK